MLTFHEIYSRLPTVQESPRIKSRYFFGFIIFCLVAFVCLLLVGSHLNNKILSYSAWIPFALMPMTLLAYIVVEAWSRRNIVGKPENHLLVWLDGRFADEITVAGVLAKESLFELKCMRERLEAELQARERWLDVLKPFSILVPALLILASSDSFSLPDAAQKTFKVFGAAWLSGLSIGAISLYSGLPKLRRLSSTLQHAISIGEDRKEKLFRKVSRKRSDDVARRGHGVS